MKRRTHSRLPEPDAYGNYWLGPDHKVGPAIFHSGGNQNDKLPKDKFFVLMGVTSGLLWSLDSRLRYFDTAKDALAAINDELETFTVGAES